MRYYPCYLDLKDKKVCVIGGGNVAKRKVDLLIKTGAIIHLISPEIISDFEELINKKRLIYHCKKYEKEDIIDAWLVFAATNDPELNHQIKNDANKLKCFCNVVTEEENDLIVPSIIERGDLIISITTSGGFPGLSKKIKEKLEVLFPKNYDKIVDLLSIIRKKLIKNLNSHDKKSLISLLLEYADPELNLSTDKIKEELKEKFKNYEILLND